MHTWAFGRSIPKLPCDQVVFPELTGNLALQQILLGLLLITRPRQSLIASLLLELRNPLALEPGPERILEPSPDPINLAWPHYPTPLGLYANEVCQSFSQSNAKDVHVLGHRVFFVCVCVPPCAKGSHSIQIPFKQGDGEGI